MYVDRRNSAIKIRPIGDIPESLPKDEEIRDDEYKGPEATSGARGGSGEASGQGGKGEIGRAHV